MGCSPWDREESDTTEWLHFHFSLSCIGKGNGNPLQCSCLENPRDGGAWLAAVYGVAQSRTRLKWLSSSSSIASLVAQMVKNLPAMQETRVQFLGQEDPLEKGMATHSSILAWTIPWTKDPGRLQSIGPQRAGHNWATNIAIENAFNLLREPRIKRSECWIYLGNMWRNQVLSEVLCLCEASNPRSLGYTHHVISLCLHNVCVTGWWTF